MGVNPAQAIDVAGHGCTSRLAQHDSEARLQIEQVAGGQAADGLSDAVAEAIVGVVCPGEGSHPVGAAGRTGWRRERSAESELITL